MKPIIRLREMVRNFERRATAPRNPLARHARRIHSQGRQDGYLAAIFEALGVERGVSVEIGAWDGISYSNTRALLEGGWFGGYIEADPEKFQELKRNIEGFRASALQAMVNREPGTSLDDAIDRLELPGPLTLLCIDVDGNDYWLWKSLERHRPEVVCIEYNAYVDPRSRRTMAYDPEIRWSGDFCYGASAGALYALGEELGYTLVGFEPGLDLFFVRNDRFENSGLERIPLEAIPAGRRLNPFRRQGATDQMVDPASDA